MWPAGARQDAGANCTFPIPAGVFNDSANLACPTGPCNRVLNTATEGCGGSEAINGQLCYLQCYGGAFGGSIAICANGTWLQESNDCGECCGAFCGACIRLHLQPEWQMLL